MQKFFTNVPCRFQCKVYNVQDEMAFIDQSQQGRPKSLQRKITMLSKVHVIWTWALLSYVYFRECALWEQKGKRTLSWLKTIISTMHKKAKKKEYSCVVLVRASWYEIMSTQASLSRHNFLCCFATGHSDQFVPAAFPKTCTCIHGHYFLVVRKHAVAGIVMQPWQ